MSKRYRAGDSIEDLCRACKTDRLHTVIVVDADGHPIRVVCDFCRSEHNFRGGPRIATGGAERVFTASTPSPREAVRTPADPLPLVSDRERVTSAMSIDSTQD